MRFRLRTLLIVLAVGPVVLAWAWWDRGVALGLIGGIVLSALVFLLAAMIEVIVEQLRRQKR